MSGDYATHDEQLQFVRDTFNWAQVNRCPFNADDIVSLTGWDYTRGDCAEEDFNCIVTLCDGRRFAMSGGCDTTGWDCRSSIHASPFVEAA